MATESELQAESEEIGASLLTMIDGVERVQDDGTSSRAVLVNAESGDRERNPERWWQWNATVVLAPEAAITPQEAGQQMVDLLVAEGWTAGETVEHETGGGTELRRSTDAGSWYVDIGYTRREPPAPQNLSITLVSPHTTKD
ncbi:hypothetical protein [Isoptericola croceus]|uniref:hypothetical protein n=1 Tax=Isoptericola croceus TaxID=3031406 RepID=UPI0023F9D004|nr:hypothetical protein [Isoptericola croceus]